MTRTLRTAVVGALLTLGGSVAALNLHPAATVLSIVVSAVALYVLVVPSRGLYRGDLEVTETVTGETLGRVRRILCSVFSSAEKSVKIVSGSMTPVVHFSTDVWEEWRAALDRHVSVTIILGDPDERGLDQLREKVEPTQWAEFLAWVRSGRVALYRAVKPLSPHFVVIDDTHAFLEEPHAGVAEPRGKEKRVWHLLYFSDLARTQADLFARLVDQAPRVVV